MIIICPIILDFQSKLNMSSSNPIIEIMTAQTPIVIKSCSALPKKIVAMTKATEVAIPPNGDIFLLLNLFSLLTVFFLNCFVKCIKVLFNKADKVMAKSAVTTIGS